MTAPKRTTIRPGSHSAGTSRRRWYQPLTILYGRSTCASQQPGTSIGSPSLSEPARWTRSGSATNRHSPSRDSLGRERSLTRALALDARRGHALDDVALEHEVDEQHRDGRDDRTGHDQAGVARELALEAPQAGRQRAVVLTDDRGPQVVVPEGQEGDDGQRR